MRPLTPALYATVWLLSCHKDDPAPADPTLSGAALATRISLDLRGVRPSPDELAWAAVDPDAVEALRDAWLDDARLPERMAWLYNDTLHTAVWFEGYSRFGDLDFETWSSMGQEPLQLVAAIIAEDRPFSELVTATELPANNALATAWGLSRAAGDGWTAATATDGRPMAGLLSSTSVWNRYNADITNRNRARANFLARALLCADFLDREVSFDFALSAEALAQMETTAQTEPTCLSCHAALDPLAAFLGGYTERSQEEPLEQYRQYSPYTAQWYAAWTSPAYYGHPGADLVDLGAMIAADPRFSTCAARRFAEGLLGGPADDDWVQGLGDDLRGHDLLIRPLLADITDGAAYRAPDERMLTTEQLASSLTEALGLTTPSGESEGLNPLYWSPERRVMGGGTDDDTVLQRNRTPGVGVLALQRWAAAQVVPTALATDVARDDRVLYTLVDPTDADPAEETVRRQLAAWYVRVLSHPVSPTDDEVTALYTLWEEARADADVETAWTEALSALVRHPRAVLY